MLWVKQKNQNARNDSFTFNQTLYLTKNFFKSIKKNICNCLIVPIPKMHRHFIRIISENREYVKTHCSDLHNPFYFACRKWYLDNQLP